jgi:transposase-like protein
MDVNQTSAENTQSITPKLKASIIALMQTGTSISLLAKEYKISINTLYQWRKKASAEKDSDADISKLSINELRDLVKHLQKQNLLLQQREVVLKKAAMILGENTK